MHLSIAFFRLLSCIAAGGFVSLALVPEGEVSRGFFRFSAALYAGLIVAALAVGHAAASVPAFACIGGAAALGAIQAALVPALGTRAGRKLIALAALASLAGVAFDA